MGPHNLIPLLSRVEGLRLSNIESAFNLPRENDSLLVDVLSSGNWTKQMEEEEKQANKQIM